MQETIADARKRARDAGWQVRLHKPKTKPAYYSMRKSGVVHTTKGYQFALPDALWLMAQHVVLDERNKAYEARIAKARVYFEPSLLPP